MHSAAGSGGALLAVPAASAARLLACPGYTPSEAQTLALGAVAPEGRGDKVQREAQRRLGAVHT